MNSLFFQTYLIYCSQVHFRASGCKINTIIDAFVAFLDCFFVFTSSFQRKIIPREKPINNKLIHQNFSENSGVEKFAIDLRLIVTIILVQSETGPKALGLGCAQRGAAAVYYSSANAVISLSLFAFQFNNTIQEYECRIHSTIFCQSVRKIGFYAQFCKKSSYVILR